MPPACRRGGQEEPVGGLPTLGAGRPLTEPPQQRLRVVGCGLDMDHSPMVLFPVELS